MTARSSVFSLALAVAMAAAPTRVLAQGVDQSNASIGGGFAGSYFWGAQTFRPTANTVAGAGFNMWAFGGAQPNVPILIELWGNGTGAGRTLLAGGTSTFSLSANENRMIDVFWDAVTVTPGAQYLITVHTPGQPAVETTYAATPYAGGGAWFSGTFSDNEPVLYDNYEQYGYDMTFEEFSESPTGAPEPASVVLMATGLLGMGVIARRRRGDRDGVQVTLCPGAQ